MKKMFGFFAVLVMLVCGMIMEEAVQASAMEVSVSDDEMNFYCDTIEELCDYAYDHDVDGFASNGQRVYNVFWRPVEDNQNDCVFTIVASVDGQLFVGSKQVARAEVGCLAAEMIWNYYDTQVF